MSELERLQARVAELEAQLAPGRPGDLPDSADGRFVQLLCAIPESVLIHDSEGVILVANEVAAERLGWSTGELVGRHLSAIVDSDYVPRIADRVAQTIGTGTTRFETAYQTRNGERFEAEVSECPIDYQGQQAVLSVARDVTSRLRAVRELAAREELLRALFERSPMGIEFYDSDGWRRQANDAVKAIFGLSLVPDQYNLFDHLSPHHAEPLQHGEVISYEMTFDPQQLSVPSSLTGSRHVGVTMFPVYHGDNTRRGYYVLYEDCTERRTAEEALRQASRLEATATLAGGIAHDFNNLMVTVLGNAELLRHGVGGLGRAQDQMGAIVEAAHRAGSLARQLLAFARGAPWDPRPLDLNTVVREVLDLERHSIPPGIELHGELADELWPLEGDPSQLSQVLLNLCSNAAEAIASHGRITLHTECVILDGPQAAELRPLAPGRHVKLSVTDTGCGMDRETLSRVFEPFFTTKRAGRGLGLAAMYGIVKQHGGHVAVTSQPQQGTTFELYFPAGERHAKPVATAEPALVKGTETVLVIDDEDHVRETTRRLLEILGYRVLTANGGAQAIELIESYADSIHLALLDLGMPILSGTELYPHLKRRRPDMEVLICTGYELDATARKLLDQGAAGFVPKPFRLHALAAAVRGALDESGAG